MTEAMPSPAPAATEAVVFQKDARVRADQNLAVTEFGLGALVGVALAFAVVLRAGRAMALRVRG